jgi:hypothetical protein
MRSSAAAMKRRRHARAPGDGRRVDRDPPLDRERRMPLDGLPAADIIYRRSSKAPPFVYACVLRVADANGKMQAVAVIDNRHERPGVDTHHLHRYAQGVRQDPEPLPYEIRSNNSAAGQAIAWLADHREDLTRAARANS